MPLPQSHRFGAIERVDGMNAIRAKLKEKGLTQDKVEKILGLPEKAMSKILRGKRDLSGEEVLALSRLLGTTPEELLDGGHGFAESEAEYIPEPQLEDEEIRLATLLYKDGRADTMVVNSPALVLEGLMPGDRILVDLRAKPKRGDCVVVRFLDEDQASAETLLRVYKPPFLAPSSVDRSFEPLSLDDNRVQVKGVIVGSYRSTSRAA